MKKYLYFALITLITLSCSQSDDLLDNTITNNSLVIPSNLYAEIPHTESRVVFYNKTESWNDSETVNSRTYADIDSTNLSEYFQYWSPDDAISVFFTTQNLQYQLQSGEDESIGKFTLVNNSNSGTGEELSTDYYYSVYPYKEDTKISHNGQITYTFPTTQHYNFDKEDSYANGENGMVAIKSINETDSILEFKNFCSYLQLQLTNSNSKVVKKILLQSKNENDYIAGVGTINVNANEDPTVEMISNKSYKMINLDCGAGVALSPTKSTKFWFVLPGGIEFKDGFSITVIFTDGTYYKKTRDTGIEIERNHIQPMKNLVTDETKLNVPIRYQYNDSTINKEFDISDNSFYDASGNVLTVIDQKKVNNEWVVILDGFLYKIGRNTFQNPEPDIKYIKIEDPSQEYIELEECAFYGCTAEQIIINNNINTIGEQVFLAAKVEELIINGEINTIEENAFLSCTSLKKIDIDLVNIIEKNAFQNCENLESIEATSINTIQSDAFADCKNLTSINVNSINTIEESAFEELENLEIIKSNSIDTIGESAFTGCVKLKTIDVTTINSIGASAFEDCESLETINVQAIETIGNKAFKDCESLETINIETINTIGEKAFNGCDNLISVNVKTIEEIEESAFSKCESLETVNIETINTIGTKAFYECEELKTINITNLETIEAYAFAECSSLTDINIQSVEYIRTRAFSNCTSLKTVTLPSSLISIGQGAFVGSGLETVNSLKETAPDGYIYMFPDNTKIFIPTGCLEGYDKEYWTSWPDNEWNNKETPKYIIEEKNIQ